MRLSSSTHGRLVMCRAGITPRRLRAVLPARPTGFPEATEFAATGGFSETGGFAEKAGFAAVSEYGPEKECSVSDRPVRAAMSSRLVECRRVTSGCAVTGVLVTGLAVGLAVGLGAPAAALAVAAARPVEAVPADTGPADAGPIEACSPGDLLAELTGAQGGAGQVHADLVLANQGNRACALAGYPAVFQVDATGAAVGAPAVADGPRGPSVILWPGQRAAAGLSGTSAGLVAGRSAGAEATGMSVIPPGGDGVLKVAGFTEAGGFSAGEWAALRVTALRPFPGDPIPDNPIPDHTLTGAHPST
ncbi:DUF4232 domain-containing protein [Parafrankia sp. BMG5.11]|nr:DUF4232 domain-containing protein [Parafrankia sp. BMG5.11]SQD95506.1 conserved hypothetical protein [Parafrankia sp. Ea1.12]